MIAIIETEGPGEGNRHVAGANMMMAVLYAIALIFLGKTLVGAIRTVGFDSSAVGLSWTLAVVLALAAIHCVAAYGARRGRRCYVAAI
jgi:hypothetical protein